MRRILIDNKLEELAKRFSQNLFSGRRKDFTEPTTRLRRLCFFLRAKGYDSKLSDYVENLHYYYRTILRLKPCEFKEWYEKWFDKLSADDYIKEIEVNNDANDRIYHLPVGKHQFNELVIWAMRYDDLRERDIFPYLQELHIKSCVYCNAQYTVTLEDVMDEDGNSKKWVALYQLDHFRPKSKYPFLCTTFFNLQPSCGNCNLHKGNNDGFFSIYTESNDDKDLNPFWFEIYPIEKIDSVYGYKAENIEIKLCSHDANLKAKHQEYFMVDDVYRHHRKEVEEAIVRLQFNTATYRRQLQRSLTKLFPDGVESPERFFWGHEMDENKVFERPLNKLIQDVVKFVK